jgi:hypothetical protein
MSPLAERQRSFAAALVDPGKPVPAGLIGPDGEPSVRRFGVYRNNVVVGLTAALKDAYPAVHRIVGNEFFEAMARSYVVADLPRTPMMFDYGAGFPAFIRGFAPASVVPYLADVAAIERGWIEAYHAAEASPIDPTALAALDPAGLPGLRLVLHPSLRTLSSTFPALTIWQMNVSGGAPAPVDLDAGGEAVLIIRPEAVVDVRLVPQCVLTFIRAIAKDGPVLVAFEQALRGNPRFDLTSMLHDLMRCGAVIGYEPTKRLLST